MVSWIKKVTNEDVLRRAQTERQLMKQIVKRQCSFLGHNKERRHRMSNGNRGSRRKER